MFNIDLNNFIVVNNDDELLAENKDVVDVKESDLEIKQSNLYSLYYLPKTKQIMRLKTRRNYLNKGLLQNVQLVVIDETETKLTLEDIFSCLFD